MSDAPTKTTPVPLSEAEVWVFDLDNTLYPPTSELFAQVDVLIRDYVARLLDLPKGAAYKLQKRYFKDYGTTLRGLMTLHDVDPHDFMAFVHDIDLGVIAADPLLDQALAALPGRKVIFTNASRIHASRVLERLGVAHHFEGVFDVEDGDYIPKPDRRTYELMTARFGLDPARAVMVEDMACNLKPAFDMGFTTAWVETDLEWARAGADGGHVHHVVHDLPRWLLAVAED